MYTVDVQTTVFFILKRLIANTLRGESECRMKSGKELCTNIRLYNRRPRGWNGKQEFSLPVALLRTTYHTNITTMLKTEKLPLVINEIP